MQAHAERLCGDNEIMWFDRGKRAYVLIECREIESPPIRGAVSYATVMHEIGHNAERRIMPHGRRRNLRPYRGATCWLGIIWPNFREGW
jgi:hypothetical protein